MDGDFNYLPWKKAIDTQLPRCHIFFVTLLYPCVRKQTPDMIDCLKLHSLHNGLFVTLSFCISRPISRHFFTPIVQCVICRLLPFHHCHSHFIFVVFVPLKCCLFSELEFLFLDQEEKRTALCSFWQNKVSTMGEAVRENDDDLRHRRWKMIFTTVQQFVQCTLEEMCLEWERWQNFSGLFNSNGLCIFVTHTPRMSE